MEWREEKIISPPLVAFRPSVCRPRGVEGRPICEGKGQLKEEAVKNSRKCQPSATAETQHRPVETFLRGSVERMINRPPFPLPLENIADHRRTADGRRGLRSSRAHRLKLYTDRPQPPTRWFPHFEASKRRWHGWRRFATMLRCTVALVGWLVGEASRSRIAACDIRLGAISLLAPFTPPRRPAIAIWGIDGTSPESRSKISSPDR